jgi:hypothetical protein
MSLEWVSVDIAALLSLRVIVKLKKSMKGMKDIYYEEGSGQEEQEEQEERPYAGHEAQRGRAVVA